MENDLWNPTLKRQEGARSRCWVPVCLCIVDMVWGFQVEHDQAENKLKMQMWECTFLKVIVFLIDDDFIPLKKYKKKYLDVIKEVTMRGMKVEKGVRGQAHI